MFKFYNRCVFCFEQLPIEPKGVGEHVIPKNIYGFWRIYDVCEGCKQYFGDCIDQLSLQNADILNAIQTLKLPDADKFGAQLSYVGTDTIDKRRIPMIRKDGKFKIKSTMKDKDFLECSEDDWKTFGVRWLENNVRHRVSKEEFDKEIEALKVKYDLLEPGGIVHSDVLDYSIRKRQTYNVEINKESLSPITKLIAKIVVCFSWLVFSPQQIATLSNFELLVNHARFGASLKEFLINWCPPAREIEYYKFHRLRVCVFDCTQIIDVTLFGYPNWRTVLGSTTPIALKDKDGMDLEEIQLILDFEELHRRRKYIALKYTNEDQIRYHELEM